MSKVLDYDALAKQHGAVVDYDALASQHGGNSGDATDQKIAKIKAGLATQTQYNDTNPDSLQARVAGFQSEVQKNPIIHTLFPPATNPETGHHDPYGVERGMATPLPERFENAPPAGALFQQVKSKLTSGAPLDAPTVNKWLDVPAKDMAHGANPGQRLIDEKLLGDTKEATRANVQTNLNDASTQLKSYLRGAGAQGVEIDGRSIVDKALNNAASNLRSPTDETFTKTIEGIRNKIAQRFPDIDKLSPEQAHQLKVYLGDQIDWRTPERNPINDSLQEIYRGINDEIKSKVHGIGDVQKRWGDLYVAHRNLSDAIIDDMRGRGTGVNAPSNPSPLDKLKQLGVQYGPAIAKGAGATGLLWELLKDKLKD